MKSFTKFFVLILAMLFTVGIVAQQQMSEQEYQVLQQKAQQELAAHGPTHDVPYAPNDVRATGDDCSDPIIITASPGMSAWSDMSQTTCGRVDDYDATCMGSYDGGEDIIYELDVTADMSLKFIFDPVETYSGIAVMDACGNAGSCLVLKTGSSTDVREFTYAFTAGTYYIQVDSWPSPDCIGFDLTIEEYFPPAPADPINTFPYMEDFSACDWPSTMKPFAGAEAHAVVRSDAGVEGCGALLDGNSYAGFYHEYGGNCDNAFNFNYPDHTAQIQMTVEPDGSTGLLWLDFDMQQFFSFADYYSWFRVTANGTALTEVNTGKTCFQSDDPYGSGWQHLEYALADYQNDPSFELYIEYVGKYYYLYYRGGDAVMIDNVHIWYKPVGNVEGTAYNGVMTDPVENVEIGFLGDNPPYAPIMTNASGYYRFNNVPTEPVDTYDMYGYKDMMNYVVQTITFITGSTITVDWNMAPPLMVVTPAVLEETMNPNEWRSVPITITNGPTGGPLHWTAEIVFGDPPPAPGNHVSVPPFEGSVPPALAAESNELAPQGYGVAGQNAQNDGSRGVMAFGYEAIANGTFNFDVDDLPGKTQVGGGSPGGDFIGGMAFNMEDENEVFASGFYQAKLYSIDRSTGTFTVIGDLGGGVYQASDMTVDPTDGTYYLSTTSDLYTVDVTTGAATKVGSFGVASNMMIGIACDGEGNLWGYTILNDMFYSIDKTTGAATPVGGIGFNASYAQSMFYDQQDDRVIMSAFNAGNFYAEIREVDVTTGGSTVLSSEYYVEMTGSAAPVSTAGGGWLDLSAYEGDVPSGESNFVNALFDATGTVAGQVWTADVIFTAQPSVSTATVDVSMIIAGEPLVPVDEFEAELANAVTGQVDMSWSFASEDITFQYFLVRRDGSPIANTQNMYYTDYLPTYGTYYYTVSAVYAEGESVPAGPVEVIWLIPELCWNPDPVYGEVWTGDQETFPLVLENCGEGQLAFEFTGFDDPDFSNGFVTAVEPYSGVIAEGESMTVNVTFDATGYGAGTYNVDLDLATNELPPDNERTIACQMVAYTPATLYGVVTDCDDDFPVNHVTVVATNTATSDVFTGETDAMGYYEFYVDEGTYDLQFIKLSYLSTDVAGIYAPAGTMTEVNACIVENPYPVNWVVADPNEADDACMITWSLPMGPYEIIYDDGTAENYFAWIQYGGAVAVKFTPAGYPASVVGGRLYVGDGSFPEGANFIGAPMAVGIMDDDGPSGMPGTIMDSAMVTVDQYGWVDFSLNGSTFNDGNFYIVMWQLTIPPFSPPVGVDEENPVVYRSYTKQAGGEWQTSAYNDFMIRATVFGPGDNVVAAMAEGPSVIPPKPTDGAHIAAKMPMALPGTIKGGAFMPVANQEADRDLEKYNVAFVDGFDPGAGETPQDGTLTIIKTTKNNYYNDATAWDAAPPGFYAYAVRAVYTSSKSIWAYSNVAAHLMDRMVTVNVSQCDNEEPSGVVVMLMGYDYPYQMLVQVTPASGTVVFDSVIMGMYDLSASKIGYQAWEDPNFLVNGDKIVDIVLQENAYPARNLYVDPLSSVATWDEPLYLQVPMEGFESEPFPPAGWTSLTSGIGWERVEDGSSSFWTVPTPPEEAGDWYIVANDDQVSWNNGCCDYMITPECDLREATDYVLHFLSYYDGAYGQKAYVEYSTDAGATWEVLIELSPAFSWEEYNYDLSDMSGENGLSSVWFAFHADDNGGWASGWAVDNIQVGDGPVDIDGYYVYLDDGFVAQTDADTRTYTYGDLQYGTTYTAAVAALYGCNVSEKIYYTFTSGYLYPPRNLYDEYLYGTNEVPLFWNPPMTGDGVPMAGASDGNYAKGIYEASFGAAPINGVAVAEGEEPNQEFLNGYRAPDVYGVSNDIPAYAWFDAENTGVVNQITSWPGGGAFANAAEMMHGNPDFMYEIDNAGTVRKLDIPNASVETLGSISVQPLAMALDYTTGVYYVNDQSENLYTVDPEGLTTELVGNFGYTGQWIIGMTFDEDGNLYGYDLVSDNMWAIDKETGAATLLGNIGFDANFGQGMAWDQLNGQAVLSAFNSGTFACEYRVADLTTGNTSFVSNIGSPGATQFGTIAIPVTGGGGGGGVVPAGLTSFNIYRSGTLVGTAPYTGEGTEDWIFFADNGVMPGTYYYGVTALYDLAVYGFPGETGESLPDGPDTVTVVWGYDLPFMESWDQGSFDYNDWTTTASNWVISSQNGNPEPSAQYNWDPDPGADYAVSLVSPPLNADMLTEGDIWLDFEYYLEDRNTTGEEKLAVEVYNGQDWTQVAEYSNTSDFDWTPQHLKITQYAMSRVFQVRFTAMGMNAFDIVRWNVDNIEVYRTCGTPEDLEGEYVWNDLDNFGAALNWVAPELPTPPEGWIEWDDGTNFSGIGLTDGGTFTVAARWDAGGLPDLQGTSITKIKFFPQDDGAESFTVKVWKGENASTLLASQEVASVVVGTWNEIVLDTPVPYDDTQELWIGYTVNNHTAGTFPAGTDAGPAIAGYGDKITLDGVTWDNLSDFGLDYNWNLAAYLEVPEGMSAEVTPLVDNTVYNKSVSTPVRGAVHENGISNGNQVDRAFTGFNIYRQGPGESDYTLIDFVAYEEGTMDYSYFDEDPYPGQYPYTACYQVTSVWESETDYCESEPAPAKLMPIEDFVCVLITSIDDPMAGEVTALYPNPARELVNITSSQAMTHLTIVNYVGQVVYDAAITDQTTLTLNTGAYDAGVYVVRITTDNGVVTKRMTITK